MIVSPMNLIIAILFFSSSAFCDAPEDVAGWKECTWGMTSEQIRNSVDHVTELPERKEYSVLGSYAELGIPNYKIAGGTFNVYFRMSNRSDRLVSVCLMLIKSEANVPQKHLFDKLEALLTRKYGDAIWSNDDVVSITAAYTREWTFPTTSISLYYQYVIALPGMLDDVQSIVGGMMYVEYSPTVNWDEDKL
jgi:hypothetical protein